MKELNILDLRFGFYVENYPHNQFPRSEIATFSKNATLVN